MTDKQTTEETPVERIYNVRHAPAEMQAYLDKLKASINYKEEVLIGVVDADTFPTKIGVTENPDGWLSIRKDGAPVIVLRDNYALEDYRWKSVVAHELVHAIHWQADKFVLDRLPPEEAESYMQLVEDVVKPLTMMLMIGEHLDARWVEDDEEEHDD